MHLNSMFLITIMLLFFYVNCNYGAETTNYIEVLEIILHNNGIQFTENYNDGLPSINVLLALSNKSKGNYICIFAGKIMVNSPKKTRYVIYYRDRDTIIPFSGGLILLSDEGVILANNELATQKNEFVKNIRLLQKEMEVFAQVTIAEGLKIRNEYYAFAEDKIYLVRMEDGGGELVRKNFTFLRANADEKTFNEIVSEYKKLLFSERYSEKLFALNWLAGLHRPLSSVIETPYFESRNQINAFLIMQNQDDVVKLLNEMSLNADFWIRSAALAALQPKYAEINQFEYLARSLKDIFEASSATVPASTNQKNND